MMQTTSVAAAAAAADADDADADAASAHVSHARRLLHVFSPRCLI